MLMKLTPVESGGNVAFTQIYLNEKMTTQINRQTAPCAFYKERSEFVDCGKKQIWEMIKTRINCTIAILRSIIPVNSEISQCNSHFEAGITYKIMQNIFAEFSRKSQLNNCPMPCQYNSYNIKLRYLHKNAWIEHEDDNLSNDSSLLAISYSSLLVEERIETIVYDLENLVTSVGGQLGLFLGFSCFSTLLTFLKFVCKV